MKLNQNKKAGHFTAVQNFKLERSKLHRIMRMMFGTLAAYGSLIAGDLAKLDTSDEMMSALTDLKGTFKPSDFSSPYEYYLEAQTVALFGKCEAFTSPKAKENAQKTFLECEAKCKGVNETFSNQDSILSLGRDFNSVIHGASRKIASWLSDVKPFDSSYFRFGPGASYGTSGDTSIYAKLHNDAEITIGLAHFLGPLKHEFPAFLGQKTQVVRGSKLTFVPKNFMTERPICIEPSINGFLQLGLGSQLKGVLLTQGCNLFDQSRNQRLAKLAAQEKLCTIDLKSASDTIAYNVVAHLLPYDWFSALDLVRSPCYTPDGGKTWQELSKFSSMGNGYTFELESMIFYALALSVCEYLGIPTTYVGVYGDDIIVPDAVARLLIEILSKCGFSINKEKSFFGESRFFESCGKDYFDGEDVRPVYLSNDEWRITDVYQVYNKWRTILDNLDRIGGVSADINPYCPVLDQIVHSVPGCLRTFGYESEGRERSYFYHGKTELWKTRRNGPFLDIKGIVESTPRIVPSNEDPLWMWAKLYTPRSAAPPKEFRLPSWLYPDDTEGYTLRAQTGRNSNVTRSLKWLRA